MGSLPTLVLNLMNFARIEGSASLHIHSRTPLKSIILKIIQDVNDLPQSLKSWHCGPHPLPLKGSF